MKRLLYAIMLVTVAGLSACQSAAAPPSTIEMPGVPPDCRPAPAGSRSRCRRTGILRAFQ